MPYFGRPRLVNAFLSKLLFASARLRVATQRMRNRIRFRNTNLRPADAGAVADQYRRLTREGPTRLNLGGGPKNLAGFINIDLAPHPNVEREVVANLLDLSFIPDGSVAQVHSNQVIEHIEKDQLASQLLSYHRILEDGGLLSIRCPNALGVCYGFWFGAVAETDHPGFLAAGYPPDEDFADPRDGWYHRDLFALLHWLYGDAGNPFNQHHSQFTPTSLREAIEAAGFLVLKASQPEASQLVVMARKVAPGSS